MIRTALVESQCSCWVDTTSLLSSIPPATFATRDLTTADEVRAADAAADYGTDEASDGWMEDTPERAASNYHRSPEDSTFSHSSADGRYKHKPNYQKYVFNESLLYAVGWDFISSNWRCTACHFLPIFMPTSSPPAATWQRCYFQVAFGVQIPSAIRQDKYISIIYKLWLKMVSVGLD